VLTFLKGETRTKRRRVEAKQQHTHILTCSCEGREEGREGMSGWGHAEKEEKKRNNIRRGKTHRSHLCCLLCPTSFSFVALSLIGRLEFAIHFSLTVAAAFIREDAGKNYNNMKRRMTLQTAMNMEYTYACFLLLLFGHSCHSLSNPLSSLAQSALIPLHHPSSFPAPFFSCSLRTPQPNHTIPACAPRRHPPLLRMRRQTPAQALSSISSLPVPPHPPSVASSVHHNLITPSPLVPPDANTP